MQFQVLKVVVLNCSFNPSLAAKNHSKSVKNSGVLKSIKITGLKATKSDDFSVAKILTNKEEVLFEGAPSKTELIVPFISILTVIGIIPFISTLLRQFWVRYKITNRRVSIQSGFQGSNKVEIVYRDIKKVSYITRFGGACADIVILLKDNARLEIRSLPDWERNVQIIKDNCPDGISWD